MGRLHFFQPIWALNWKLWLKPCGVPQEDDVPKKSRKKMLQMLQIKHCFGWNHSSLSVPNQQMEVPPIRVPPKYTGAGGCPSFEFMHTLTHRFSDPQSYATSGLLVHWDQHGSTTFFHGKDMKTSTADQGTSYLLKRKLASKGGLSKTGKRRRIQRRR